MSPSNRAARSVCLWSRAHRLRPHLGRGDRESYNRRLRAGLIGSQLTGVLMTRYLFGAPTLVDVDPDALVEAIAPAVDHYLTGDLGKDLPSDPRTT